MKVLDFMITQNLKPDKGTDYFLYNPFFLMTSENGEDRKFIPKSPLIKM